MEKTELKYWYLKRKLGITIHFSEIIKLQFEGEKKAINCFVFHCLITDWSKSVGWGAPEQRGGGLSVFEPLAGGGSCNFQLPMGVGHSTY